MTLTQEITLDIYEEKYFEYINAKQADNISRILVVTLTANGQVIKPDAEGEQAVFRALKPDGTSVIDPAVIGQDGKVTVALTAQALACAGQVEADVSILRDEMILSSATFYIQVAAAPLGRSITSENEFLLLTQARQAAEAAAQAAAEGAEQIKESLESVRRSELQAQQYAAEAQTGAETASEQAGAASDSAEAARQAGEDAEEQTRQAAEHAGASRESAESAAADAARAEEAAETAQSIAQGALGYYADPETLAQIHPQADDGNWAIVGTTDTIWIWDSDSGAWTDSGNKTDLSQYYTKTEADEILTGAEERLDAALTAKLLLLAHPVGSLYWSMEATDPAELFGGTWERIKDRFVLAAGDTYKAGTSGGAASVTTGGSSASSTAGSSAASTGTSSLQYTYDSNTGYTGSTALTVENLPYHTHGSRSLVGSGRLRSIGVQSGDTFMSASGIIKTSVESWAGSHAGLQDEQGVSQDQAFTIDATHEHDGVGAGWGHSHTMSHAHYMDHTHSIAHTHTMAHTHTVATMPPYTVAYCWKRTA